MYKRQTWSSIANRKREKIHIGRIIASQVAYNLFALPTISDNHPDLPYLHLAAKIMENTSLHPLVREQGGAYGSGAVINGALGVFYFYSYRDPNIVKTANAFITTLHNLAEEKFTQKDIVEATLTLIQKFDTPVSPSAKSEIAYGWKRIGKSFAYRKRYRDAILSASSGDIARAVGAHLLPQLKNRVFVSYAGEALLQQSSSGLNTLGMPLKIKSLSEKN